MLMIMMGKEDPSEGFDSDSTELFESLGHPLRITILDSLRNGGLSFSELKRRTQIKSSGHLIFHLSKLDGLVEATPGGNYELTPKGREALILADRIRQRGNRFGVGGSGKALDRRVLAALIVLAILSIPTIWAGLASLIPVRQPSYVLVSLDVMLSPNLTVGFSMNNSAPIAVTAVWIGANGTDLFSFPDMYVAPGVRTELNGQPLRGIELKYGMTYNISATVRMEDGRVLSDWRLVSLQMPDVNLIGYSFGTNFRLDLP
jgi:DNA-binding HxlR family transcriptional regulator